MSSIDTSLAVDTTVAYEPPIAETPATTSASGFSAVLADALKEQMKTSVIAAGSGGMGGTSGLGGLGGLSGLQGYNMNSPATAGIEQAIMAAAASGEVSDAQVALFMLCMMMQGEQDGEFSMLMQMMASMITNLQGDTQALRGDVMRSDYSTYLLDTIDRLVFGGDTTGENYGGTILPVSRGRPTTPAITSNENIRSRGLYRAVINQFRVETAERYRPSEGKTYCNIFLWDVTSAMGAEIPHYVDAETNEPRTYPDVKGARELNAVAIDKWLHEHGEKYGWREVDAETAQRYANEGKPAVTTAGAVGHVQVVCPSNGGTYDPAKGVTIAQAGRRLYNYAYISSTYGAETLKNISYFVHD
jgi:hypothetical protein